MGTAQPLSDPQPSSFCLLQLWISRAAFRFLRQPSRPNAPRPVAKRVECSWQRTQPLRGNREPQRWYCGAFGETYVCDCWSWGQLQFGHK